MPTTADRCVLLAEEIRQHTDAKTCSECAAINTAARYRHTCAWTCRACGQRGLSWPGAFLATWRAHWAYAHDPVTDTAVSIFARSYR